MKQFIMINEIVNEDIEETAKNVKSSEEAGEVINKMEKIIKSNKCNILWLAYQQGQIFERFKMNDNFFDMVKKFGISKSTILFKISMVKFVHKYPRMKKSPLCPHFLNNNFKIIKEICHEILVNLSRSSTFLVNIFILKLFKK